MAGTKEYVIKINGVEQGVTSVTKLEDAMNALDASVKRVNTSNTKSATTTRQKTSAMTEEEKAAAKLAATQARIAAADSAANKAQIQATQQLRERTREVTRSIQINQLAEGSIKQMGMQLTDLRNEYEALSAAQREDEAVGGRLLEQIQALDAEYKALRESTGNFRDSVGNYGRALEGLEGLSVKIEGVTKSSMGLAQGLVGTNQLMSLFGQNSEEAAEQNEKLNQIIGLLSIAEQVNTNIVKEGILAGKLEAATTAVRTVQLRAKTAAEAASTKGTIAATAAQKAFNLVAAANPYVLLALAIVAVGAALYTFTRNTADAADKQKALNEQQQAFLDLLESEANVIKTVSEERVRQLERQLALLEAQGNKTNEIRLIEDRLGKERATNNARLRGFYANELADLEANRKKLIELQYVLQQLRDAQAAGFETLVVDVDLDGTAEKEDIEDAIEAVQGQIDNLGRKVQIAVELNTEQQDLENEERVRQAQRVREARDRAREMQDAEIEAVRAAQDARVQLTLDANERERIITSRNYDRQIEDIRKRLERETNLTVAARRALNDTITSLEAQKYRELERLQEEQATRELETQRELEDSMTALIIGGQERQRAEINAQYDRRIEDLRRTLDEDKTLTEAQIKAITQIMLNEEKARGIALRQVAADEINQRAELELQAIEDNATAARDRIGKVLVRDTGGLKLIDVEATRRNLEDTDRVLDEYVRKLIEYRDTLQASHEATLSTLQEGTPEYIAELQRYAKAQEDITKRIKDTQREQIDNAKMAGTIITEYYKGMFEELAKYADVAAQTITTITDTFNMGLQASLDAMNEQLDTVNERYEEAAKQREEAAKGVEETEKQLQEATGGTAVALRQQLADQMAARNEAEREEKRIAKEREKLEADIAKREKQMRRNDLIAGIAQATANTAQGVTKSLADVPWPLNFVVAGIVGGMGLVQVGIMGKQLAKLAEGGELDGPSHANGGVQINVGGKPAYEAEGGEFVVNKASYAANEGLVRFINDSPYTLTAADIIGAMPSDGAQVAITDIQTSSEDRLVEALNSIEFRPVVAVTDILDVADEVTEVRELADF